jgi:hypothetical protein
MPKNAKVDEWFRKYDNPQKEAMQQVREIILAASPKITEEIKWSAPTFAYKGNLASFSPRAKQFVHLMFHTGATIPDTTGLLEGEAAQVRVARFYDQADVKRKKSALTKVVRAWVKLRDQADK